MSFIKTSNMTVLAHWELEQPIQRTAGLQKMASFFAEPQNTEQLDVKAMLAKIASDYDISPNPKDYIFEAVRAVTAGVPNENGDAFHKNELLRYDHRLKKAVYQTFILKPHHVNHRADNPKTARGVVLDAHYNDSNPAMELCPNCQSRTAGVEDRDATGLYCKKCGHTVKDEFVEILLAVDKAKDPNFAEGVRTGVLNATSMGCVCDSTTCNVCNHVAYTRQQFCQHIKGGNKKKTFKTAAGDKIAFEWCNNVVFTEDSRVDQPADPTALQQEILSIAASLDLRKSAAADMQNETEILILTKQLNEARARLAQLQPQAPAPVQAPATAPTTQTLGTDSIHQPGSIEQFVQEQDQQKDIAPPMSQEEMGILDAPAVQDGTGMGAKASVNDNILSELGAIANRYAENRTKKGNQMSFKFKTAYNSLRAGVTSEGNCRVYTKAGTLFVVRPTEKLENREARTAFATQVLSHIASHGIVPTMKSFEVAKSPKIASVLEHVMVDFDGGRKDGDTKPATANADTTGEDKVRGEPAKSPLEKLETDRADQIWENKGKDDSALGGHTEDFEGGREDKSDSIQSDGGSDMAEKREKKTLKDTVLDGVTTDHQHPKTAQMDETASKPSASKPSASKPSASKPSKPSASKPSKEAAPPSRPDVADPVAGAPSAAPAPAGEMPPEVAGMQLADAKPGEYAIYLAPVPAAAPMGAAPMADAPHGEMPMGMAAGKKAALPSFIRDQKGSKSKSSSKPSASKSASKPSKSATVSKEASIDKDAAQKKYESRMERVYKARIAILREEASKREASVVQTVSEKFKRAMRLAATRQQLNLEESPIKIAIADVLLNPMDLGDGDIYSGMDERLATTLTEQATAGGFQAFVDAIINRAAELMNVSDETFGHLEADIKNLRPVAPPVADIAADQRQANQKREAARSGNLSIAPATSEGEITPRHDRRALTAALGTTRVRQHHKRVLGE